MSGEFELSNDNRGHFVEVETIISQSETISPQLRSSIDLLDMAKKKYLKLHNGSKESILLSGYSENKWSQ